MANQIVPTIADVAQIELMERLNKRIDVLSRSERITKIQLGLVSREVVEYITLNGSPDVGTVNRLLSVLSPTHKEMAILFFTEFLPHSLKEGTFGGKLKGNKYEDIFNKAKAFLADEGNDIWTWAKGNIKPLEKKAKDYFNKIVNDVKKALTDEEYGITKEEVLLAILSAGIGVEEMFAVIDKATEKKAA